MVYHKATYVDSNGQTAGLIGAILDITERKQAEEELRFRNAILSTQQEATIDGILVVNGSGDIVSSNRRFAEMWGIPPEIIASKSDERALRFGDGQARESRGVHRQGEVPLRQS